MFPMPFMNNCHCIYLKCYFFSIFYCVYICIAQKLWEEWHAHYTILTYMIVVVQLFSCVQLFAAPLTAAHQASLSITISWSLPKLMSMESVRPSSHLVLCHPLLLPPSVFPSIRVFSGESALRIRWPKYWSFSFSISPSNEYSGLISFRIDWFAVQGLSRVFSNTTVRKHQFLGIQLSL